MVHEIDAMCAGFGEPHALTSAFDSAVVFVPTMGRDVLVTGVAGGRSWVCGFSGEGEYQRFLADHAPESAWWGCLAVEGARLRDAVARARDSAGIAIDVAGERPCFFPRDAGNGGV